MPALTSEQRAWRSKGVGSSDASVIITGDQRAWDRLIEEKKNPDLERSRDGELLKRLGHVVEDLCIQWFHEKVSPIAQKSVAMEYPPDPFLRCLLDGMSSDYLPVEAKFHSGEKDMDEMVRWYWPQLQHQMIVSEVGRIWIAVIFARYGRFSAVKVERDNEWCEGYLLQVMAFRHYMLTGEFTGKLLPKKEPVIFNTAPYVWTPKSKDFNEVTDAAIDFMTTMEEAERHMTARERLKALMPEKERLAVWRRGNEGLQLTRNKAGSITIKVMKED